MSNKNVRTGFREQMKDFIWDHFAKLSFINVTCRVQIKSLYFVKSYNTFYFKSPFFSTLCKPRVRAPHQCCIATLAAEVSVELSARVPGWRLKRADSSPAIIQCQRSENAGFCGAPNPLLHSASLTESMSTSLSTPVLMSIDLFTPRPQMWSFVAGVGKLDKLNTTLTPLHSSLER